MYLTIEEITSVIHGLDFQEFLRDGDYYESAYTYLMRKSMGARGRVIYERYEAINPGPIVVVPESCWISSSS